MKVFNLCCRSVLVLALAFLFAIQPVLAEEWWESKQAGSPTDQITSTPSSRPGVVASASRTNWENGYIEVMAGATADMRDTINLGHAYSIATKTARHLAYEKLAETVNGLNLYSDATYDRELMMDANLRTVMRAMIRGALVVNEKKSRFSDGSIWVEVTLGLKLIGEDGIVGPSVDWQQRHPEKMMPAEKPRPVKHVPPVAPPASLSTRYTGLIIDATGLGASPAMLPKIVSQDGQILYGTGEIKRDYVVQMGLMGYQSTISKARAQDRVGANPLVIKAVSVSGKSKCDYVISRADAALLNAAASTAPFLKECRVVAVVD